MLSWWKKKVSNGLKSASQNEHYTTAKRSYSISSTISATASTIRTDKELSSTGELDKFDRDKSKIQDKSVTQCIKTFINWTNWILYGDQNYHDDMVKKIEDFKEPILVERFLRKISGNSPFEVTGETRNAKNDDKYWEYTADENSDSNHMNDNGSDSEINAYKVDRMDRCINYLMSHRRSFSVDMDISARNIVSGQVSSILKLIWLTIVRFRLEAVAEKQLLSIKMESSEELYNKKISNLSGYNLLLQYCNSRLELYKNGDIIAELVDFSKSWCTGAALLCLVHSYAGKEVPGLSEYIDGVHMHMSPSSSKNTVTPGKMFLSLNSFPNPPENGMKGETGTSLAPNNQCSDSRMSDSELNTALNQIKYLLFAGNRGSIKDCLEMALRVAEEHMSVPELMSAEHMMEGCDELSMLAYLSEFFWICDMFNKNQIASENVLARKNFVLEETRNGNLIEDVDKHMSDYINEATNLLDLLLTLSNENYNFISIIKLDKKFPAAKLSCEKSDWFYPIIACINDPKCSLEKLKYVCNNVLSKVEKKISEHLASSDVNVAHEKMHDKKSSGFEIQTSTTSSGKEDILLFEVLSRMEKLRVSYKNIFSVANLSSDTVNTAEHTESKVDTPKYGTIASKDLSNLTFLHEQIDKQLEEFLFGAFEDAKKAIEEYLTFLTTAKAELDSLEEELTCKVYNDNGMISEAKKLASAIKELMLLKDDILQENTPPEGRTDSNPSNPTRIKTNNSIGEIIMFNEPYSNEDITYDAISRNLSNCIQTPSITVSRNVSSCTQASFTTTNHETKGCKIEPFSVNENKNKTEINERRNFISDCKESLPEYAFVSKSNSIENKYAFKPIHDEFCHKCNSWYFSSPENRMLFLNYICQFVAKLLLRLMNLSSDAFDHDKLKFPSFCAELINNKYDDIEKCCILKILAKEFNISHKDSFLSPLLKKKYLSITGENNPTYNGSSFVSTSTNNQKLTALLLTCQNMITRAEHIIDVLRARFCLSSKDLTEKGAFMHRTKEAYYPLATFPVAIRDQVKKLIGIADKEIIQYLRNNVNSSCMSKLLKENEFSIIISNNPSLSPLITASATAMKNDSITPSPSQNANLSTNVGYYSCSINKSWYDIIQKIEAYCRKCFFLESLVKVGVIDIEILEMENKLKQFNNPSINAQLTFIIKDLDPYTARDFVLDISSNECPILNLDYIGDKNDHSSIEFESLDTLWQEILQLIVGNSADQGGSEYFYKIAPHSNLKSNIENMQNMYECNKQRKVLECVMGAIKMGSEYAKLELSTADDVKELEIDTDSNVHADKDAYSVTENVCTIKEDAHTITEAQVDRGAETAAIDQIANDTLLVKTLEQGDKGSSKLNFKIKELKKTTINPDISPPVINVYVDKNSNSLSARVNEVCVNDLYMPVNTDTEANNTVLYSEIPSVPKSELSVKFHEAEDTFKSIENIESIDENVACICKMAHDQLDKISSEKIHLFAELESALCKIDMKKTSILTIVELYERNLCMVVNGVNELNTNLALDIMNMCKTQNIIINSISIQEHDKKSILQILPAYSEQEQYSYILSFMEEFPKCKFAITSVLYRISTLHYYLKIAEKHVDKITKYAVQMQKSEELITAELCRIGQELSLLQKDKGIYLKLSFEKEDLFKPYKKYVESLGEQVDIINLNNENEDEPQNEISGQNVLDAEFVDVVTNSINGKLSKMIATEYENTKEELNKKMSNFELVLQELFTFSNMLENFTVSYDAQIKIEAKITPPMFIVPFDIVNKTNENYECSDDERVVEVSELDKLLHIPLMEKIDEDIISESKVRQSSRRASLKKLQCVSSKVLSISRQYEDEVSKCIGEIVKDRLEKVSLQYGRLEFVCIEVRSCIEKHLSYLRKINKLKEDIIANTDNVLAKFNDLTEKIRTDECVMKSAEITGSYINEFRNLMNNVSNIFNLAKNIKNEIIKSDAPVNDLKNLLTYSGQVQDNSFNHVENNRRKLVIAAKVYASLATAIGKIRQDIFACANIIILKSIYSCTDAINIANDQGLGETHQKMIDILHSYIGGSLNAEAYIPLARIRCKTLLTDLICIDKQLSNIGERYDFLEIVYNSWNLLVQGIFRQKQFSKDVYLVQKKYVNALRNYFKLISNYSYLCKLISINQFSTIITTLVHKVLKKTLPFNMHSDQVVTRNAVELLESKKSIPLEFKQVYLKYMDSSLYHISTMSEQVLTCGSLHLMALILGNNIIEKIVHQNGQKYTSSHVEPEYADNFASNIDQCNDNAKKINALVKCIVNLLNNERVYAIELCNDILQKSYKDINADNKCWECCTKHINRYLVVLRYMATIIFENSVKFIRLKNYIWNYQTCSKSDEKVYAFDVYKHFFGLLGIECDNNLQQITDGLIDLFANFLTLIDEVVKEFNELLEYMQWVENALEVCVPIMRSLNVRMNKLLSSNIKRRKVRAKESRLVKHWGNLLYSWDTQIYQIIYEPPEFDSMSQLHADHPQIDIYNSVSMDSKYHITLLNVQGQSCYEYKQEISETFKSVVESVLLYEISLLKKTYLSVLEATK